MVNDKNSVVSLQAFKESRDYEKYLCTLGQSQLEVEMRSILNSECPTSLSKGKSLLKEIGTRADHPVRLKIQKFREDLTH